MLRTRADLEGELQNQIMAANNSSLFGALRLTDLIQKATIWAGNQYFWPALQRARTTTANKNTQNLTYDYYDYPPDFKLNSIARIYIDGVQYFNKRYQDLMDYADNTGMDQSPPDNTNHFFANFGRQYFTYPSYTPIGSVNNLIVWGFIQHPDLANSTDTTIFSNWDERGNEAIVKKAFELGMMRLSPAESASALAEAKDLLVQTWLPVSAELQKSQSLQHPMFLVPDFFKGNTPPNSVGTFNTVNIQW